MTLLRRLGVLAARAAALLALALAELATSAAPAARAAGLRVATAFDPDGLRPPRLARARPPGDRGDADAGGHPSELHTSPGTQFFPMITQAKVSLAEFGFTGTTEDAWQGLNGLRHTWDANGGGTFDGGRHSNPRLDALIDAIPTEPDAGRRHALIDEALKLADDDIAYVPLYRRTLSWVMQKKVQAVMLPDDTLPVRWVHVR